MSDTASTATSVPTPNPSTYRQVIENMAKIFSISGNLDLLMESVGNVSDLPLTVKEMSEIVDKLNDMFLKTDSSGGTSGGDLVATDNGVKIIGVHVTTSNSEVDTPASEYPQGLTVELKNVSVIGLSGKTGMESPYCFVFTMVKDSSLSGEPEEIDYKPMQLAFANSLMYTYARFADTPDSEWGTWKEREEQTVRQQIVDSTSEPTDQLEGEYWLELIGVEDTETAEYSFETIADDAETSGDDLETMDADELANYDIM